MVSCGNGSPRASIAAPPMSPSSVRNGDPPPSAAVLLRGRAPPDRDFGTDTITRKHRDHGAHVSVLAFDFMQSFARAEDVCARTRRSRLRGEQEPSWSTPWTRQCLAKGSMGTYCFHHRAAQRLAREIDDQRALVVAAELRDERA